MEFWRQRKMLIRWRCCAADASADTTADCWCNSWHDSWQIPSVLLRRIRKVAKYGKNSCVNNRKLWKKIEGFHLVLNLAPFFVDIFGHFREGIKKRKDFGSSSVVIFFHSPFLSDFRMFFVIIDFFHNWTHSCFSCFHRILFRAREMFWNERIPKLRGVLNINFLVFFYLLGD